MDFSGFFIDIPYYSMTESLSNMIDNRLKHDEATMYIKKMSMLQMNIKAKSQTFSESIAFPVSRSIIY